MTRSVVNLGRWVRELQQELGDGPLCLFEPRYDRDAVVDAWLYNDTGFHVNLGVWPGLPGSYKCNLCAHLQCVALESVVSAWDDAIPLVRDLDPRADGECPINCVGMSRKETRVDSNAG